MVKMQVEQSSLPQPSITYDGRARYRALDAVRGAGALIVVFAHAAPLLTGTGALHSTNPGNLFESSNPLFVLEALARITIFWMGQQSVIIFFVLSGFVLTPSMLSDRRESYGAYLARRALRLFPPTVAVVLLTALLMAICDMAAQPGFSYLYHTLWPDPLTASGILRHILLFDPHPDRAFGYSYNVVLWTMQVEWHCSILLPLLVLLVRRSSLAPIVAAGALFTVAIAERQLLGTNALASLKYAPYFVFGILLVKHREQVAAFVQSLSGRGLAVGWLLCAALVYARALLPEGTSTQLLNLLFGLGATLVMATIIGSKRAQHMLDKRVLNWAGQVSFSLYLVHMPLLIAMPRLLPNEMPAVLQVTMAVVLSLVVADIMYRTVEIRSLNWGKQTARWLERHQRGSRLVPPVAPACEGGTSSDEGSLKTGLKTSAHSSRATYGV
jgi:peptidoglycan/LPS O-acetylase OafA/YrhL